MLGPGGRRLTPRAVAEGTRRDMAADLTGWVARAPALTCDRDSLATTYRRSLVDLAALRFAPAIAGSRALPAAGLPWFMTMFDDVRPRQHLHEPAGAAVHPRTGDDDAPGPGRLAGQPDRRLPRRGPRPHPARDALRRADGLPGAPALPV